MCKNSCTLRLFFDTIFYRNALLENNFLQAKDVIMACKDRLCVNTVTEDEKDKKDLILCLKTLRETFRFLRNCCAEVPKNQSWAM